MSPLLLVHKRGKAKQRIEIIMSRWSIVYDTPAKRMLFRLGYRASDIDAWKERAQFRRLVGRDTLTDKIVLWMFENQWETKPHLPETIPDHLDNVVSRREVSAMGTPKSGYQHPIGSIS